MKVKFVLPHSFTMRDLVVILVVIFLTLCAVVAFEAYHISSQSSTEEDISVPQIIISSPDTQIFEKLREKN